MNPFRLAATANGWTVAARAASNALATACACPAVPVARAAASLRNRVYGAAAAVIAADAGPCHAWPVNPDVIAENDDAAEDNSSANPFQAAAAANMGAEPAPENIRAELTSGDNTEKFIRTVPSLSVRGNHARCAIADDTPRVPLHEIRNPKVRVI
jgi:hypothetical protein